MIKKTKKQAVAIDILSDPGKRYILLYGGSRAGKTLIFCYALVVRALKTESRHLIARLHYTDVKSSVGMDTLPKVLHALDVPYELNKSKWFFKFPNGSEIWLGGLDDDDRVEKILGLEYSSILFNEGSQIPYHSYSTALTRLAQKTTLVNRAYIDCNPPTKSHWLYKYFLQRIDPVTRVELPFKDAIAVLDMNPQDNIDNLPPNYISETLSGLSERMRRRFRDGEWLDDPDGALWKREQIDKYRHIGQVGNLRRIVVAVDPAVSSGEKSAETGIIVVGRDDANHYYVLFDNSVRGTPFEWATAVKRTFERFDADKIVGEVNNGGDLVEVNIKTVWNNPNKVPYESVRASRGKIIRADPVQSLYEKGFVHHVGEFPELEEQMCEWIPGQSSPDRMDALVWGISYLSGEYKSGNKADISHAVPNRVNIPPIGGYNPFARKQGY